jgi:hypothetical protein
MLEKGDGNQVLGNVEKEMSKIWEKILDFQQTGRFKVLWYNFAWFCFQTLTSFIPYEAGCYLLWSE